MLTNFKKAVVASALAMAPFASQALTVDGVTFEAGAQFITTSLWESVLTSSTGTLSGVGIVNQIDNAGGAGTTWTNGTNDTQLTYFFTGFTVAKWYDATGAAHLAGDEGSGANSFALAKAIDFTGGLTNIYADRISTGTKLNPSVGGATIASDIAKATDGNLWLAYAGHTFTSLDVNLGLRTGTLIGDVDSATNIHLGNKGIGYLDAVGGEVFGNFNTDSQDLLKDGLADARFDAKTSTGQSGAWPLSGIASFKTTAIPEPGTLALAGIGLLGLGFGGKRRKVS